MGRTIHLANRAVLNRETQEVDRFTEFQILMGTPATDLPIIAQMFKQAAEGVEEAIKDGYSKRKLQIRVNSTTLERVQPESEKERKKKAKQAEIIKKAEEEAKAALENIKKVKGG